MSKRGPYAKSAERREEILQAALDVIADRGYHGATLRAIGRELGIEPAHIHYHFGSREGLLRELLQRWDTLSGERAAEVGTLAMFTLAIENNRRIRGVVHLYLAFAVEVVQKDHAALEFFQERFRMLITLLSDVIQQGKDQGVIRPGVVPERAARWIVALSDGLQLQWLIDGDIDAASDLSAFIDDLFVSGTQQSIG